MKAHQRIIREQMAATDWCEMYMEEKLSFAESLSNAQVLPIEYETAADIILQYEWLGNMGTTEFAYGLFFGCHLAGAVCFGRTAGTNVSSSICGEKWADAVVTLCRGACVWWAHEHSASFLIANACKQVVRDFGKNIFVAYSDTEAGEIGTVYQACNWLYCGMTSPTEKFKTPDGEVKDARLVQAYTRDRRGGITRFTRTRQEQKQLMVDSGHEFFKGCPKHRYVGIYGTKALQRELRKSLKWMQLDYPKRNNNQG